MQHLNNIPPFYIGQKVIYIGTEITKLDKSKIHMVTELYHNEYGCWEVTVDGIPFKMQELEDPYSTHWYCQSCKKDYPITSNNTKLPYAWDSRDFKAIQKFPLIKLSKIQEKEPTFCAS